MLIVLVALISIVTIVKYHDEYEHMNKFLVASEGLLNIIAITLIVASKIDVVISIILANTTLLELSQYIYYNSKYKDGRLLLGILYLNKIVMMIITFLILFKIY